MTKRKPIYSFHGKNYYPVLGELIQDLKNNKRFLLKLEFKNNNSNDGIKWLVIMKNPSRAGLSNPMESDKTINTIAEYFSRKLLELNVKELIIVNLFPIYLTDSSKLQDCSSSDLIDFKNIKVIKEQILLSDKIVFAWGTHPSGCKNEFEQMKRKVFKLAHNKKCYQMLKDGKEANVNRPLHGQVWGYDTYKLVQFKFDKID